MKTIIVPTDFSPVATNAALYGASLAQSMNASLALLHVCQLPVVYAEVPVPLVTTAELTNEAEEKIARLKVELMRVTGDKIKIYTDIKVGSVPSELKAYCNAIKPYAVVMGSHGTSGLERFLFGSNTIWAMKHLSWPLIVVPADAKYNTIRNIGLACDFKAVVDTAPVEEIKTLVKDLHANLHVLYINKEFRKDEYDPKLIEESGLLQEMLGDLHPHYHFVDHEDIDQGISEYAEKYFLDLLIVVPKRHALMERLFHRSHTSQLALHTHIPVMSVHE